MLLSSPTCFQKQLGRKWSWVFIHLMVELLVWVDVRVWSCGCLAEVFYPTMKSSDITRAKGKLWPQKETQALIHNVNLSTSYGRCDSKQLSNMTSTPSRLSSSPVETLPNIHISVKTDLVCELLRKMPLAHS